MYLYFNIEYVICNYNEIEISLMSLLIVCKYRKYVKIGGGFLIKKKYVFY